MTADGDGDAQGGTQEDEARPVSPKLFGQLLTGFGMIGLLRGLQLGNEPLLVFPAILLILGIFTWNPFEVFSDD